MTKGLFLCLSLPVYFHLSVWYCLLCSFLLFCLFGWFFSSVLNCNCIHCKLRLLNQVTICYRGVDVKFWLGIRPNCSLILIFPLATQVIWGKYNILFLIHFPYLRNEVNNIHLTGLLRGLMKMTFKCLQHDKYSVNWDVIILILHVYIFPGFCFLMTGITNYIKSVLWSIPAEMCASKWPHTLFWRHSICAFTLSSL